MVGFVDLVTDVTVVAAEKESYQEEQYHQGKYDNANQFVWNHPEDDGTVQNLLVRAVGDLHNGFVTAKHVLIAYDGLIEHLIELTGATRQNVAGRGININGSKFTSEHISDGYLADWLHVDITTVLQYFGKVNGPRFKQLANFIAFGNGKGLGC